MANHKSALKAHRQNRARRERNRVERSRLRTVIKKYRKAVAEGDVEQAKTLLPDTLSLLDRTAQRRAIHPNAADRTKGRLTRALARITSAS
jgi:small subunit ribosomal protein S20